MTDNGEGRGRDGRGGTPPMDGEVGKRFSLSGKRGDRRNSEKLSRSMIEGRERREGSFRVRRLRAILFEWL